MSETVALNKKRQSKFAKKITKIKDKVKKGDVKLKETVVPPARKPQVEKGVIYIGHVPHGFYEEEMRSYFKQFGKVTNVRVCRSAKTGRSKGYAFVEFLEPEVAKVAAETMDNYLMFKRRLSVKNIPPEKQHRNYFRDTRRSETKFPHKGKLVKSMKVRNKNMDAATHILKAKKATRRLQKKLDKLAELGIQHNFQPVELPDPLQGTEKLIESDEEGDARVKVNQSKNKKKALQDTQKLIESDSEDDHENGENQIMNKRGKDATITKANLLRVIQKKKNVLADKKEKIKGTLKGDKMKLMAKSILNDSGLVNKVKAKGKMFKKK